MRGGMKRAAGCGAVLLTLVSSGGRPVAAQQAQQAQRRVEDLRCLSDQPGQCLTTPVPRDEPHSAVCATCHDLFVQPSLADAVATCTSAGCHASPEALSPFHAGHAPTVLANCMRCHDPHDARIPGAGHDCLVCHTGGGEGVPPRAWERAAAAGPPPAPDPTLWQVRYRAVVCAACHEPVPPPAGGR